MSLEYRFGFWQIAYYPQINLVTLEKSGGFLWGRNKKAGQGRDKMAG